MLLIIFILHLSCDQGSFAKFDFENEWCNRQLVWYIIAQKLLRCLLGWHVIQFQKQYSESPTLNMPTAKLKCDLRRKHFEVTQKNFSLFSWCSDSIPWDEHHHEKSHRISEKILSVTFFFLHCSQANLREVFCIHSFEHLTPCESITECLFGVCQMIQDTTWGFSVGPWALRIIQKSQRVRDRSTGTQKRTFTRKKKPTRIWSVFYYYFLNSILSRKKRHHERNHFGCLRKLVKASGL